MSREDRTVAFADISGSTRLFEGHGDEVALAISQNVLYRCAEIIAQHEGQVVKTIGDEVMAMFTSPDLAVHSAITMLRWAQDDRDMCEHSLGLRVGLHHGQVLSEKGDIFGSTVNTAAKLVSLAASGQIVTSSSTRDAIDESLNELCRALGVTNIPGRQDALEIVSVIWENDTSNLTAVPTSPGFMAAARSKQLVLTHAEGQVTLSKESPPITLGRDSACSVVLEGDCVSRHHARVEFRHGFFVLMDQSTNGTWITVDGQSPVLVHRGELPLLRDGGLSLGERASQDAPPSLAIRLRDA